MSKKEKAGADADQQLPEDPLARIAHIEEFLLAEAGRGKLPYEIAMKQFRAALDEAAKTNVWDLVDCAFSRLTITSYELLVRASVELRLALDVQDRRVGAPARPDLAANAERVERIALFLFESAEKYSKSRHVVAIARRADDEKIVDLAAARRRAKRKKRKKASRRAAGGGRK